MCDTRYEPPQAYFHHFPDKPFIKIEKKSSKKGKKPATDKTCTLGNAEWETFDLGSLLVSKNPTYFRKLDIKVKKNSIILILLFENSSFLKNEFSLRWSIF